MEFMPIFTRLTGRPVLVVGGGEVAHRKVELLGQAGARITVVAPQLCPDLKDGGERGEWRVILGEFQPEMMEGMFLTIAATDDPAVNAQVFETGEKLGRLVNAVDDPKHCSFITPSILDRSPIVAAISSGGAAPVLARHLRMELEARWPETLSGLARIVRSHRAEIAARFANIRSRRRFYEMLLEHSDLHALLRTGCDVDATAVLRRLLRETDPSTFACGQVALVGAGPGDPGLLTLRALRHLSKADIILHDRLVSPEILAKARRDAKLLSVEKTPGGGGWRQEDILAEMLAHARAGMHVVRLKGGDPFVFGRGGEEAEFLRAHQIPVEVVPGITAVLGCAASVGIPLTHRADAHALLLVSAVGRGGVPSLLNEPGAGDPGCTVAVYMGASAAPRIQAALLSQGRDPTTPFAIVEHGSTPRQRVRFGALDSLGRIAAEPPVQSPALLILGETVARAPGFIPQPKTPEEVEVVSASMMESMP